MCRAYDEATLIPYWVRHAQTFAERVIVYLDEDTDDGTGFLAGREGAEIVVVPSVGLDDGAFVTFAQEHYREARDHAQWVCWTDADEIVYAPNLAHWLDTLRSQGVTCPSVQGYAMVADAPPCGEGQIYEELTRGFPASDYSKVCVFDPDLDVLWEPGRHRAMVRGNVVRDDGSNPIKLLHYRYLGAGWCQKRHARNWERITNGQRQTGLGRETSPNWTGAYSVAWYERQAALAQEVVGI
jgi:hypothetical protein